jgi:membrane-bound ClpP family serine protease
MIKILLILIGLLPSLSFAASDITALDLTSHWAGYLAVILFVIAYAFVMLEEFTHFRKSKPVILVAGIIWGIIGWVYASQLLQQHDEYLQMHKPSQ